MTWSSSNVYLVSMVLRMRHGSPRHVRILGALTDLGGLKPRRLNSELVTELVNIRMSVHVNIFMRVIRS